MEQIRARSLLSNAVSSLAVGLLWPTVVMFATTKLYVHFLGVRMYAVFAVVNTVLALAGTLRVGSAEATVKYVAQYRAAKDSERLAGVVGGTLVVYFVAAAIGGTGIGLVAPHVAGSILGLTGGGLEVATTAIRVAAIGFPASLLISGAGSVFAGFERYDLSTRTSAGALTLSSCAGVTAILLGGGVVHLITATVTATWLVAIVATIFAWRWSGLGVLTRTSCVRGLRTVLGFGAFSSVNAISYTLFNTVDRLIVGSVLGAEAVSYYSVSASVASRIYTVTIAMTQALLPRFSATASSAEGERGAPRLFYSALAAVIVFSAVAAGVMSASAGWLLQAWLGDAFAAAATHTLVILCWAFAVLAVSIVPYYYLNAVGRPGLATGWFVAGGLLEFGGMVLLGRAFGLTGILAAVGLFPLTLLGLLAASMRHVGGPAPQRREVGVLAALALGVGFGSAVSGFLASHAVFIASASPVAALATAAVTSAAVAMIAVAWGRRLELQVLDTLWVRFESLRLRRAMENR